MEPAKLLHHLNTLHQTSFTLLEKYPDGEQGAFAITDHLGRQWVLKWTPGARNVQWIRGVQTVTDLLRDLGYPVPSYEIIGAIPQGMYSIQCALPGTPLRTVTPTLLPRLFELNELQRGRAIPGRNDWHQEAIDTVLFGGEGYCLHTLLQQHSRETVELLQTLQTVVQAYQDAPHRNSDIVHGDFQHANILMQDGQVSGVVDWDGFGTGDSMFDIATLLFYSYGSIEVREHLWHYALARASLTLLSIYLAHLILRQVDWSLRYHDLTTSERYIRRGHLLLEEITHRAVR